MNYKKLGNTNLDVSTICLGTMTWGEQNTQDEGFEQMDYSLDHGINFFDTAELYAVPPKKETYGYTEEIIGNWFQKTKKRDKVILATKVAGPARNYLRGGQNSFVGKNLDDALEASLKRLKTDYIDLYQLHWPERNVNSFGKLGYEHKENKWNSFEEVLDNLKLPKGSHLINQRILFFLDQYIYLTLQEHLQIYSIHFPYEHNQVFQNYLHFFLANEVDKDQYNQF